MDRSYKMGRTPLRRNIRPPSARPTRLGRRQRQAWRGGQHAAKTAAQPTGSRNRSCTFVIIAAIVCTRPYTPKHYLSYLRPHMSTHVYTRAHTRAQTRVDTCSISLPSPRASIVRMHTSIVHPHIHLHFCTQFPSPDPASRTRYRHRTGAHAYAHACTQFHTRAYAHIYTRRTCRPSPSPATSQGTSVVRVVLRC